jgi:serine protease Do
MRLRDTLLFGLTAGVAGGLVNAALSPAAHLPSAALFTAPAWATADLAPPDAVADTAERAVRSVVHISASQTAQVSLPPGFERMMPFGMPPGGFQRGGVGSGVLVDARGLILTNHHVVADAEKLTVTLHDGRQVTAKVRGSDPATDVALIELEEPVSGLEPLELGDSEQLRLGQTVLAIGNPFGLQGTVTMGIVSALDRGGMGLADYEDFIQTDAAINPGNSGGALVDARGRLVGINTAIHSLSGGYEGVGFAIPSNMASEIMSRLLADGRVVRGYLGVGIEDVDPAKTQTLGLGELPHGAMVRTVEPGSPSAAAGLEPGDVIVEVDGVAVRDAAHLRRQIAMKGATADVALKVIRGGRPLDLRARTGELDAARALSRGSAPQPGPRGR